MVESGEDLAELEVSVSQLREEVRTQRAAKAAAAEERRRRLEAARVAGLVPPVSGDEAGPLVQPSETKVVVHCPKSLFAVDTLSFFTIT